MANMFITNDVYWSLYLYGHPEPPICILSVGTSSVQSGGALIFSSSSSRFRKLILNRENISHFMCIHRCLALGRL